MIWWSILAGLLTFLFLFLVHTAFHFFGGQHKPHVKAARHLHWHAIGGIIVGLLVSTLVGVALYRSLGFQFNPHKHVLPSAKFIKAGQVAPAAWSLANALPSYVYNQGNTLACVAFSLTTARWMQAVENGNQPPDVYSPFYTYWWVT